MPTAKLQGRPLTDAETAAVRAAGTQLRQHPQAGHLIADALRRDFPELGSRILTRLALRLAAYLYTADTAQPGITAADTAAALTAAAAELTAPQTAPATELG